MQIENMFVVQSSVYSCLCIITVMLFIVKVDASVEWFVNKAHFS